MTIKRKKEKKKYICMNKLINKKKEDKKSNLSKSINKPILSKPYIP
jgi:hypothetical protein